MNKKENIRKLHHQHFHEKDEKKILFMAILLLFFPLRLQKKTSPQT
jgi:hypothetical protein